MIKIPFFEYKEPASESAHKLIAKLKALGVKEVMKKDTIDAKSTAIIDQIGNAKIPDDILENFEVIERKYNGKSAWTIKPHNTNVEKVIFYVHGGGYIGGFGESHWKWILDLLNRTNCAIVTLDYPLVPKATYKEIFDMGLSVYQELLLDFPTQEVVFMGDSAGGHYIFAFAYLLQEKAIKLPKKIIGLSPWMDVSMRNPEIKEIDKIDPLLSSPILVATAEIFKGDKTLEDPIISPINAKFNKDTAPEISILIGGRDILQPDTMIFAKKMEAEDIVVKYYLYPEMIHTFMIFKEIDEAKLAQDQVVELIEN